MQLWDGPSEFYSRLDRVCGNAIPLDVTSTGNAMHVKFVSNMKVSQRGFKAKWISGEPYVCLEIHASMEET